MDREERLVRKGVNTAFWPAAHLCRISVFTSGENLGSGSAEPTPSIEIPRVKPLSGRRNPKQKDIPSDVLLSACQKSPPARSSAVRRRRNKMKSSHFQGHVPGK